MVRKKLFDNQVVEIPCGACDKKIKKCLMVIRTIPIFTCSCGSQIKISAGQFRRLLNEVKKDLKNL
jgi:hypothetical protein